jgi:hypothetical protein
MGSSIQEETRTKTMRSTKKEKPSIKEQNRLKHHHRPLIAQIKKIIYY